MPIRSIVNIFLAMLYAIITKIKAMQNKNLQNVHTTKEINRLIQEVINNGNQELDLSGRGLDSIPELIEKATSLHILELHGNNISEIPKEIGNLKNLRILKLQENQIEELSASIGLLKNLQVLLLSENSLKALPDSIGNLNNLVRLEVDENKLNKLPDSISKLKNLETLEIDNNQIKEIPKSIGELKKLKKITMNNNLLIEMPMEIGLLENLKILRIENNKLSKITTSIGNLKGIEYLHIGRNLIKKLPKSISKLKKLKLLSIEKNQIDILPDSILNLKRLRHLNLQENKLTAIPEGIKNLTELKILNLSRNHIIELNESIGSLNNLEQLHLQENSITFLPTSIGNLSSLQYLYIHGNRLKVLPNSIGNLIDLKILSLQNNELVTLPKSLQYIVSLEEIYLHRNATLNSPPEIFGPSYDEVRRRKAPPVKPQEILEYYFQMQDKSYPLNEAKLILVGFGGVGKTSVVNRLVADIFNATEDITEGINITNWQIKLSQDEHVKLHIWDFGGQEIMHSTHQFFLTERSLYLVVLNGRQGHEDSDAEYWLNLIQSFGDNSPIIVVLNKINEHSFDVNRGSLRQKFSAINSFIETDCRDGTGIESLIRNIKNTIDNLEHLRDPFPSNWRSIKDRLAGMTENYITYDRYIEICIQHGENNTSAQDALAIHLHNLGIALNYKDDRRLRDTHLLNPHWVTNGIYTLINSQHLAQRKGEFFLSELNTILNPKGYPIERHIFLVELMRKFELCFRFPGEQDHYLIPDLLDKQQPIEAEDFNSKECLNFYYEYPILPEGLLTRFIVRTHVLSDKLLRWRSGVILNFEGNQALIKADRQDRRVYIQVAGPLVGRRRLLAIIRSDFEYIHQSFKFQPDEKVPIPNYPEVSLDYRHLLILEQHGKRTCETVIDNNLFELDVRSLLNGVDINGSRKAAINNDSVDRPLKLFYSYSHNDESFKEKLITHLKLLQRQGFIENWNERQVTDREEWKGKVDANLEEADIILLLISSDFLASDYCYDSEIQRALELHHSKKATIIPLIIRDSSWHTTVFSTLQPLPIDGKPVSLWNDRDSAWRNIEEGISYFIKKIRGQIASINLAKETLLISRIKIKNIFCFTEIEINLLSSQDIKKFIILLGENGVGKTSFLRSIAIGLADEIQGTALLNKVSGNIINQKCNSGAICIELVTSISKRAYEVTTELNYEADGITTMQKYYSEDFPHEQLFICGYGAMRGSFGSEDYSEYSLSDAVGTLFDYSINLQNPELVLRRIQAEGINIEKLTECIDSILLLERRSTMLTTSGIEVSGPWGRFQPLNTLGDGYQATLSWIADLFGWSLLHDSELLSFDICGIVLIDALEQHLHPSWQRLIIKILSETFPFIQFIAATHSPICTSGLSDLDDGKADIIRISRDGFELVKYEIITPYLGWRYDQILTSNAFSLSSTRDLSTEKLIDKIRSIFESSGPNSEEFIQTMEELSARSIDVAEDERERQIQNKLLRDSEMLKQLLNDQSQDILP